MNKTHSLDKAKVEERLKQLGWYRGVHGEWIVPSFKTTSELEEDWIEALFCGLVCKHEEAIKKNEEFLKKHPTPKR